MKLPLLQRKKTAHIFKKIDLRSLRVRLTLGIATVSAICVIGIALWTGWQMQSILVNTNKQNLRYVAERFDYEVGIYVDMMSVEKAVQKAINNLTDESTLLWLKSSQGKIIAQSETMMVHPSFEALKSLPQFPMEPEIVPVDGRYWVLCGTPLQVRNRTVGKIYLAQDTTNDKSMLLRFIPKLIMTSLFCAGLMVLLIDLYVKRSLKPLKRISKLAKTISPDHLAEAQLHLNNAPSEVTELSQTFDMMLLRLHQAWENQRQFVSNVSHELRTPLTVVSGYLQSTLRRGTNLTQPQREALEIAASETDSTIQLLQDLLELARADSGNLMFKVEALILNDLVEEVVIMAKQYSNRDIKIEGNYSFVEAKADRNRLKQVLINLVDNAIKYSPDHEPVTVKLREFNNQAIIQVCDRGIGIPLQDQSRIFERFYRVDEARCRSTGGTGLGLSIVKTLVEGMGGTVTVGSKSGEGSVFTVALPISKVSSFY